MELIKKLKGFVEQTWALKDIEKRVYLYKIPEEDVPNLEMLEVLLEEDASQPSDFSDDIFHTYTEKIKMTFFYPLELPRSMQRIEIELQEDLYRYGFYVTESNAHYVDPTSGQTVKTLTVIQTQDKHDV